LCAGFPVERSIYAVRNVDSSEPSAFQACDAHSGVGQYETSF